MAKKLNKDLAKNAKLRINQICLRLYNIDKWCELFLLCIPYRRMRTVTNMYIANLAFADVTIALFAIPFQFHAALLQRWDLPAFMCQFCPTVQILSVNISIFTLVAISLDR